MSNTNFLSLDNAAAGQNKTEQVQKRLRKGVSPDMGPQPATQSEKKFKSEDTGTAIRKNSLQSGMARTRSLQS